MKMLINYSRLQDSLGGEPGRDPGPVRLHRLFGQRGQEARQLPPPPQDQVPPPEQQQSLVRKSLKRDNYYCFVMQFKYLLYSYKSGRSL